MKMQESRIIGWPTPNTSTVIDETSVSKALVDILVDLGVEDYFGIFGSGNAFFSFALQKSPVRICHTRHEGGAAFAATESYFASDRPAAVFVTTGPGLLNSLTGMFAARWDGAKLVLISASTSPKQAGRWAVQETSSYTMSMGGLFTPGPVFDYAVCMHDPGELDQVARRLQQGFSRPQGFVAHISLPISMQTAKLRCRKATAKADIRHSGCDRDLLKSCLNKLNQEHFAIWVGFGARHAAADIYLLAEKTGAAVMCTPRAKGVFPETHPQFVGVTGAGGHDHVEAYMQQHKPAYTLVLGSRLGEASSFWSPDMVPRKGFIQVDIEPECLGVAYPDVPFMGIQAEIQSFVHALTDEIQPVSLAGRRILSPLPEPEKLELRSNGPVRPQVLMQAVQKRVIDETDAIVMSESGNSFSWANHYLRFPVPRRYRTSAEFGSMGHMVTGVVGAALARKGKAVALVGDGAMLMNNEINTAVQYKVQAVWIVLNDSRYGITFQGVSALGYKPFETELPPTNFVKLAKSLGGTGVRVETETELDAALYQAMSRTKPFVVDVAVDQEEISPVVKKRAASVKKQGQQEKQDYIKLS